MVKLRVAARIIPESVYLASSEPISRSPTALREERRFYIVVQEPEKWYIGTLANAVKQKYEALYKHEFGRVKYLKDNDDDCDLDPEEKVSDLLVNEGKALTDHSDQHVTIKVIQEQGRATREGSVVPDLTPIHYHIPSRPPVPRFESVTNSLGKRKEDVEHEQRCSPGPNKRTRLSDIEEGDDHLVASVEQNQHLGHEVVIQDSQPAQARVNVSNSLDLGSPELGSSLSRAGPPHATISTSNPRAFVRALGQGGDVSKAKAEEKRHFSRSSRDPFEMPESDEEISQLPRSSRSIAKSATDMIQNGVSHVDDCSGTTGAYSNRPPRLSNDSMSEPGEEDSLSLHNHSVSRQQTKSLASSKKSKTTPSAQPDTTASAPVVGEKAPAASLASVRTLNSASSKSASRPNPLLPGKPSSGAKEPETPKKKSRRRRKDAQSALVSSEGNGHFSNSSRFDATEGKAADGARKGVISRTPSPDSASEQLSQALQESAQKGVSNPATKRKLPPKAKNISKITNGHEKSSTDSTTESSAPRLQENSSTKPRIPASSDIRLSGPYLPKNKPVTPMASAKDQTGRETSAESGVTTSSKVILPPGMTQAEFDKAIASYQDSSEDRIVSRVKPVTSLKRPASGSTDAAADSAVAPQSSSMIAHLDNKGMQGRPTDPVRASALMKPAAATGPSAEKPGRYPHISSIETGGSFSKTGDRAVGAQNNVKKPEVHNTTNSQKVQAVENAAKQLTSKVSTRPLSQQPKHGNTQTGTEKPNLAAVMDVASSTSSGKASTSKITSSVQSPTPIAKNSSKSLSSQKNTGSKVAAAAANAQSPGSAESLIKSSQIRPLGPVDLYSATDLKTLKSLAAASAASSVSNSPVPVSFLDRARAKPALGQNESESDNTESDIETESDSSDDDTLQTGKQSTTTMATAKPGTISTNGRLSSAVLDRTIRDATPDDDDSSDESDWT